MPPPSDNGFRKDQDLLANHVIVCGLGPLGGAVVRALAGLGACVVGIVADAADEDETAPTFLTIEGDPTTESVLRRAYISRASTLISTVEGDESKCAHLPCRTRAQSQHSDGSARRNFGFDKTS